MDIQTRVSNALADFDDLLLHGLTIEAALSVAAAENQISEETLAFRASRACSLEERRQQVVARAEAKREATKSADPRLGRKRPYDRRQLRFHF